MIVGNGLLARAFHARYANVDDVVVFASGVSNSLESDPNAFAREHALLEDLLASAQRRLIYFSSCGVVNQQEMSPYMQHKARMESLVTTYAGGLVLRLPQVVGYTPNPNTLTNFIRDRIIASEPFTVWAKAERNLVDIDDIVAIGSAAIDSAGPSLPIINIAAESSTPVPEIVRILEDVLQRQARCTIEDKGNQLRIDSSHASTIARRLGIDLGTGYAERVLRKYYGPTSET